MHQSISQGEAMNVMSARRWRRPAIAVSLGALVLGGGAVASAATNADPPALVHSCVSKGLLGIGKGNIRIVTASAACNGNETELTWNQQGVQGPAGPQGAAGVAGPKGDPGAKGDTGAAGATGPKGDTGATGLAGTARDVGTVNPGSEGHPAHFYPGPKGWVSLTHPSAGIYCLTPDVGSRNLATYLVVSVGGPGGAARGTVQWQGYCGTPDFAYQVLAFNVNGDPADIQFTAIVP